jgi:surfeit locus 1 family protein
MGAMIALGLWQLDRAQQKQGHADAYERVARAPSVRLSQETTRVESLELRQVEAYGRFEPHAMIWLDNRVRRGVVGYEVIMPLRIAESQLRVLVNRGWIAGTGQRQRLPELVTPSEELLVSGRAVVPGKRIFELGPDPAEGSVWQNLTIERYRARMKLGVLPIMIEQTNDVGDGLVRDWPAPDRGVDTHRGYALQWFAFAALIAVIYVALSFRRDTPSA